MNSDKYDRRFRVCNVGADSMTVFLDSSGIIIRAVSSYKNTDSTFDSAGDVEETAVVFFADVTGVKPAVVIKRFSRLLLHIQIAHEHVTPAHAYLQHIIPPRQPAYF